MNHPPALQLIPLASIQPSPYQYRTRFDDAKQQPQRSLKTGQTRSPENRLDEVAGLGRHEVTR